MKKKRTPWTWYKVALAMTYPLYVTNNWLECEYWMYEVRACSGEQTSKRWPLFCAWLAQKLEILRVIPFVWMGHHDDDERTLKRAIKATICLLLGLHAKDGDKTWNMATISWFCKRDTPSCHSGTANEWTNINVDDDRWLVHIEDDSSDWGYP